MTLSPDLLTSMQLAGQNLVDALDRDNDFLPFWELTVDRSYKAEMRRFWPAHNLGRWWDAMLRLEQAIGFEIPAFAEAGMLKNLERFFQNPFSLPLCPEEIGWGGPHMELHSMREGLLALAGLARWRNSTWARRQGRAMLESIRGLSLPDGSWNMDRVHPFNSEAIGVEYIDTTGSNGRLIEALVLFYEATGDELAFELAERFSSHHFDQTTQADGGLNLSSNSHHTHSYLGTLRGLMCFGRVSRQAKYVDRVRLTYENAVRSMVKRSGYTSHDIGEERRGETSSGGDAAQIALWLAHFGYPDYLDDAERVLRARILASQILDSPKLTPAGPAGDDRYADLDRRVLGAYGGMHRLPHGGKLNVTDVTAACLHTVIDIFNNVVERTAAGWLVNFHFDRDLPGVSVRSKRDHHGELSVTLAQPGQVLIRIPGFAQNAKLRVDGVDTAIRRVGPFALVPRALSAVLSYDLLESRFTERTNEVDYTLVMRGDDVVSISPWDDFYPFYPPVGGIK